MPSEGDTEALRMVHAGSLGRSDKMMNFATRMRDLEQEFARAAAVDGDVYLPNFTPVAPSMPF